MRRTTTTLSRSRVLATGSKAGRGTMLSRMCACGGSSGLTGECEGCRKEKLLQRRAGDHAEPTEVPSIVHEVLRSPGQPLDAATRAFFEPRFGHDFSRVRVHTDARAADSARAVNALAYTVGPHIVFGAGEYSSLNNERQRLLGHELAHALQQDGSSCSNRELQVGEGNSSAEHEATDAARQVLGGNRVSVPSRRVAVAMQRAMICSKRLEAPVVGWFANHAYIDNTGRDDCLGSSEDGNLAITELKSGNFLKGCALKTRRSPDPRERTPNRKPCEPKSGVTDVATCLNEAFNVYTDPSFYSNPSGPNSNTFAGTLVRTCCQDSSSSGLGWVPGWDHSPASGCEKEMRCEPKHLGGGAYLGRDCIIRQGAGPKF